MSTSTADTTPADLAAPEPHDEWGINALDLEAYLARVGQEAAAPSARALDALHEAHVRTIPFENIDVVLGRVPRLDLESITAKLVHRRRGGYCYEHALLFAAVLERLGYPVTRCVARVRPDLPGTRTHMLLLVHAGGVEYLADVGFGSGVLHPMPLRDGAERDQAGWPHRLTRDGRWWRLEHHTGQEWRTLHLFDDTAQRPVDYDVGNHYVATHPDSPFTGRTTVIRLDDGVCRKLVGHTLSVRYADGRDKVSTPVAAEELDTTLRSLDVALEPDELDRLQAQHETSPAHSPEE